MIRTCLHYSFKIFALFILLGLWLIPTPQGIIQAAPISNSKKYVSVQVSIIGLNPVEESLVTSSLSIKEAENEKKLYGDRIEGLHQIAPKEITTTLESLGFYHSKVSSDLHIISGVYRATYRIEKGPATRIEAIYIEIQGEGRENAELNKLKRKTTLKVGKQLKHGAYERFKEAMLSKAIQEGYLDAEFLQNEIRVNRDKQEANITLILKTGPRYKMGEAVFKDPPYPTTFLKNYLPYVEGSPYTTEKILACQKTLSETDLFKRVRVDPQLQEVENYTIPLKIRLEPRPKNKYSGSLGYGTDTGPRGRLSYEHRRVHFPGHRIHAGIRASKRLNQVDLRYSLPGPCPMRDQIVFGFKGIEEHLRDKKYSLRGDLSATLATKIDKWERLFGFHYLTEVYRELPSEPKKYSHFLLPSIGIIYRNIRPNRTPQTGLRVGLTFRGASKTLFSSTDFVQTELQLKLIDALDDKTRFIFRGELGATVARNFNEIPYSLRYFTGGDNTVRGYGYKSLGPRQLDRNGKEIVVGGRYLMVASAELERKIYKQISIAAFVDTGQASNRWRTKLATGVGLGLRYTTPLGPLRLDVAKPVAKGKHRPRIHLTFGMDL